MLKASGNPGIQWLTGVIKQVWQSGLIPSDWKKGIILPIYKGKVSPKDCRNYRGITLLSVPGKVFATVLLNKVHDQLIAHRRMEQSGLTPQLVGQRLTGLSHSTQSSKAGRSFRGLFGLLSLISRLFLTQSIIRPCGSCYAALVCTVKLWTSWKPCTRTHVVVSVLTACCPIGLQLVVASGRAVEWRLTCS